MSLERPRIRRRALSPHDHLGLRGYKGKRRYMSFARDLRSARFKRRRLRGGSARFKRRRLRVDLTLTKRRRLGVCSARTRRRRLKRIVADVTKKPRERAGLTSIIKTQISSVTDASPFRDWSRYSLVFFRFFAYFTRGSNRCSASVLGSGR